jgi:predicted nucleic acid-binding Zn ribbon protein
MTDPDRPTDPAGGSGEDRPTAASAEEQRSHDPTGLGLARAIAGSVAGGRYRRRRSRPQPPADPQSAGAHPDDRDPQLLGAAMDRLVESQGWSKQISVRLLLGKWPSLVGPVNAAHSTPVGYRDTVVTVRAESTVWATSLRSMAPQLVAKLNDALGDGTVTRVEILGPDVPSWKKGRRSVRDGRGPRDTYG